MTITKTLQEIETLLEERGSRTKIKYLKEFLAETLKLAYTLHENFMRRLDESDPEFNDHWIEEFSVRLNTCFGGIDSYFVESEGDPPSSAFRLLNSNK